MKASLFIILLSNSISLFVSAQQNTYRRNSSGAEIIGVYKYSSCQFLLQLYLYSDKTYELQHFDIHDIDRIAFGNWKIAEDTLELIYQDSLSKAEAVSWNANFSAEKVVVPYYFDRIIIHPFSLFVTDLNDSSITKISPIKTAVEVGLREILAYDRISSKEGWTELVSKVDSVVRSPISGFIVSHDSALGVIEVENEYYSVHLVGLSSSGLKKGDYVEYSSVLGVAERKRKKYHIFVAVD